MKRPKNPEEQDLDPVAYKWKSNPETNCRENADQIINILMESSVERVQFGFNKNGSPPCSGKKCYV